MTATVRRPDPPDSMWWLYALAGAALAAVGAAAGQVAHIVYNVGDFKAVQSCLLDRGIPIDGPWPATEQTAAVFAECGTTFQFTLGVVMAIGAVLVPVLAWLLMLGGGLTMRSRLRRSGAVSYRSAALSAAQERFGYWCDVAELTGRRRPVLVLGRPGKLAKQAYCIGVPFARPIVVIPAAYAYADTEELDLVVLHELAHVRAGDISWAAAAWWAGWLNLPALLIVVGPLVIRPGDLTGTFGSGLATGLTSALALSLAILMLRAALLRRREQAADRYALAVTGRPEVLRTALHVRPPRVSSRLRAWTAGHPPPGTRLSEATMPTADAWQGSFGLAAATSVVALFGYQNLYKILTSLLFLRGLDDAALAIPALLWAGVLVPAWARYSATGTRRGWWPAVTGSTAGLLAGYFLWSPGSLLAAGPVIFAGDLWLGAGWTGVVALSVTLLAVGLAVPLGSTAAMGVRTAVRRGGLAAAALATATALVTGLLLSTDLILLRHLGAGISVRRAMLPAFAGTSWWAWMPPSILLTVAIVAVTSRRRSSRPPLMFFYQILIVVIVAAATAAVTGIVLSQLRTGSLRTGDDRYLLLAQRWWICALAGWVTTAALLFTHRPVSEVDETPTPRRGMFTLPTALLAGAAATVSAGTALYARDVLADRTGRLAHDLLSDLRHPIWLELILIVVSLPVLAMCRRLIARRGDRNRSRSWRLITGTVAVSAVLCAVVATGLAAPVTIAKGDYDRYIAWVEGMKTPPPSAPPATGPLDAGRTIDAETADTALEAVGQVLPPGWAPASTGTSSNTGYQPSSCGDLFAGDDAADQARPKVSDETKTYEIQSNRHPPSGATLVVSLSSYRSPQDAAQSFAALSSEVSACPQWSMDSSQADDKRAQISVTAQTPPTMPYASYQVLVNVTFRMQSTAYRKTLVLLWSLAGHNIVKASAEESSRGPAALPGSRLNVLNSLTAVAVLKIVVSLQ
jgi:Zn-dependent protease with chaperone function